MTAAILLSLIGCDEPTDSEALSSEGYARTCRERIAVVPAFDCTDGVVAKITVDGVVPEQYTPNMTCDRPALLPYDNDDGQCIPHSRALVLRDDAEVQIAAFCRMKTIRAADSTTYDEVDVILHSVADGTTCWFQATSDTGLDGTKVPSPTLDDNPAGFPAAEAFWNPVEETVKEGCGDCHDNDPFYYSPYIAQTGQLPANPLGLYSNDVGPMSAWKPLVSLQPRGNTCIGCHRIGQTHTCGEGTQQAVGAIVNPGSDTWAQTYPHSHWMPVDNNRTMLEWKQLYPDSIAQLAACCDDPDAAGCAPQPIR